MSFSRTNAQECQTPDPPGAARPTGFQRSYSRVFYESEYTTPTSWEFRGLPTIQRPESGRNNFSHNNSGSFSLRRTPTPMNMSSSLHHPNLHHLHHSQLQSPMPNLAQQQLSFILRSNNTSAAQHSHNVEPRPDGSRNSTGSSTGSHRSHDSGFSDSSENRRQQIILQQLQALQLNHSASSPDSFKNQCQNQMKNINVQNASLSSGPTFNHSETRHFRQPTGDFSSANHLRHNLSLPVPAIPASQVPVSVVVNGKPTCLHSSFSPPGYGANNNFPFEIPQQYSSKDCANGNCSHNEIIVSRSTQGTIAPFAEMQQHPNQNGLIGAPTCCSTPKKTFSPNFTPSKMTVMQKIDNFESLNKNINVAAKILDNNNNNNQQNGSIPNSLSANSSSETRSSFFSRPPSRIPTPPPITPPPIPRQPKTLGSNSSSAAFNYSDVKTSADTTMLSNNNNYSNIGVVNESFAFLHEDEQQAAEDEEKDENAAEISSLCRPSPKLNDVSNYSNSSHTKLFTKNCSAWQSLPRGYKRVYDKENPMKEIIVKSHLDNDAVRLWLHQLRVHTEPECFHALQLKDLIYSSSDSLNDESNGEMEFNIPAFGLPLQGSSSRNNYNNNKQNHADISVPVHVVSESLLSVRYLERIANLISGEFSRICRYLEFKLYAQVPPIILALLDNIEEFLARVKDAFGFLAKQEVDLVSSCFELRRSTATYYEGVKQRANSPELVKCYGGSRQATVTGVTTHMLLTAMAEGVALIGNQFSQVVDQRLTKDLSTILDVIENDGCGARMALEALAIILYDGGMHLCRLAAGIRTVRGLLSCLLETRDEAEQIYALRCLATVLCVGEAVKDFDNAGGFEIIADILHEPCYGLVMKCEAVAVLTQVTDPWIDLEATLRNLGSHLEKIVLSLTNLASICAKDADAFLLIVAAISNLTFLELSSILMLQAFGTIPLIVKAVQQKSDFYSIYIMDHVSTILANMAGMEKCRHEVVKSDGVSVLLYFLQKSPSPFDSLPEITACERLHQKSTIAISRLSSENGVAEMVMKRGGFLRLIQLARDEKIRNYSDGVLIACLATLRKLVTVCGSELVQELHAEDLIYPRLLDSFLLFSSRQESCV